MRDYQAKKNQFWLEPTIYRRTLAIVRDYPRLLDTRRDILHGSPQKSDVVGAPKGVPSDPTAQRALRLAKVETQITHIEAAMGMVPKKYRAAVVANIIDEHHGVNREFAARRADCSASTIRYWRAVLLWEIAARMVD